MKYQKNTYRIIMICVPRQEPTTTRTLSSIGAKKNMDLDLKVNCPACPRIRFWGTFQANLRCPYPSILAVSSPSIKINEISKLSSGRLTLRKPGRSMHQRPATPTQSSEATTTTSHDCPTPTSASSTKTGRIPRASQEKWRISRSRAAT